MKCKCGCGEEIIVSGASFIPGHDLRAAMRVIKEHYGSVEAFIDHYEEMDRMDQTGIFEEGR